MEIIQGVLHGFHVALQPINLLYCFVGVFIGTLVGVLPGLGPAAAIALLLPSTFAASPVSAVIMLAGIYYGAMYGGSTTSILVNIPGEAASVVTCLDGHAMARQGRAGAALGIAAFGSFIAGTLSVVILTFLAPFLARVTLSFGPPEYFALMVLGLTLLTYFARESMVKALMMAAVGLLCGTVGQDTISGRFRFAFGIRTLEDGLGLVPVIMGLFGISEVLLNLEQREEQREIFARSEEHTSELQSLRHLVCRLLLEKKNKNEILLLTSYTRVEYYMIPMLLQPYSLRTTQKRY